MSEDKSSISSRSVSERVKQGDYTLKRKKNTKGSHAWEQFRTVCYENGDEVFGVACCVNCKTCLLYKKLVNGEQKSMGTKNLLDLKHCAWGSSTSHECASGSSLSSTETLDSEGKSTIVTRSLDSFIKCSGKKVNATIKNKIRERTAALVAAAHLPYRFVENNELDKFAQSFIEVGALYGNVPASDLIVSRTTVRREIVKKSACIQDSIKNALIEPAKHVAVSFVADLWTDNVSRSYLDVTFFWVEESGVGKRIWSLRHAMYICM